ncbi:MAG: SsrA-binding protein SmpB, partial [Acholeplasmataceae bacterium]|nr:SsrA-binding protein SmpB [Acholeplasmataceae bacterium]
MKVITKNKKAHHEYFIKETYEAGIVLKGTEIKSIRAGKCNINEAYITLKNDELFIVSMHISKYKESSIFNHAEKRDRKLLMHKREILRLKKAQEQDGYTLIPLKLYFKSALVKVEVAIAQGKK